MMRRFLAGVALVAVGACACAQTDILDAGRVVKDSGELSVPVYRVAITSDSPQLESLAKRAFGLHGSYKLARPADAQFEFAFSQAGPDSVRLTIKGGRSYEETVSGANLVNALMKACDVVVNKTIGAPGFFAGTVAFSYSRDGGDLSEICVSDMVFQKVRKLTNDKAASLMPHFSPNGKKVMYTGYYRSGFMDLFEINLSANSRRAFASFKGSNTGGAFSPDGSKVAMVLSSTGNAEVWTANADRTGFKRITNTPTAVESSVGFSPDGSKLIFASDSGYGKPQIYICPANGGKMTRLPTNVSGYCSEPVWNWVKPNLIAFTGAPRAGKGSDFQVFVYDMLKRQSKCVTRGVSASSPVWLNDGRHLICAKAFGKMRRLYVVDTETGSEKPMHTAGFGSVKEPDFVYTSK